MSVILKGAIPTLSEVSKTCGPSSLAVYSFLWSSAVTDARYDSRMHLKWDDRRDCGGTTSWSVKGIADALGLARNTVKTSIDKLLDNGFIQHINAKPSAKGKYHSVFRVTHPDMLDAVRYAIDTMSGKPSERRSKLLKTDCSVNDEIYDTTEPAPVSYISSLATH